MIGGLKAAIGSVLRIGSMVEAAVGEGAAQPLMEEQKQQRHLNALQGEAVGVTVAVALEQAVALELAQIVAELVEAVGLIGEVEGGQDGLVDFLRGPTAELSAAMQQDLEEADNARILDLDAGISDRADGDRQGNPLQERKVDMDVEPLGLEAGEAADDGLELLTHLIEMVQPFAETEVVEVVGAEFVAQQCQELLILSQNRVAEIDAEHMMAMRDLIDDGVKLAPVLAVQAGAEDLGNLVGRQPPEAEFAASLEQLVNWKVAFEYDVVAVFDLSDGVDARQLDLLALLGGKFWTEDEGPVVEAFANDIGAQLIGGRLEGGDIVNRHKGIVILAEADLGVSELMLDEVVAVEVVGGSEREERSHTHDDWAEHFVVDVEIVVGEPTPLVGEDAVVGILGGIFRHGDAEGWADLHALENEVHAVGVLLEHSAEPGQDIVFFAHALLGPADRGSMVAGEGFHPALVTTGPLT